MLMIFLQVLQLILLIKDGKHGVRTDLNAMKVANINHKKKEYYITDIKPITDYFGSTDTTIASDYKASEGEKDQQDSDIRIIRRKFEVNELDGSKKFGNFVCNYGYEILWVTEWEIVETGERGKDSLRTEMWNTDETGDLQKAKAIEKEFSSAHLKALGIDIEPTASNILGLDLSKFLGAVGKQPEIAKSTGSSRI